MPASVTATPRIIINAKVYPQVTGHDAIERLAKACQSVAQEVGSPIGLAPPTVELATVGRGLDVPDVVVFAQHVDRLEPGAGTGHVTVEAIAAAGAQGTILNHAEHKIDHDLAAETLTRVHKAGLQSLVCADGMPETRALAPLVPTYLAVEPPALIGGDVSVTKADPAIVSDAVAAVQQLSPATLTLCGAGVKTGIDVSTAIELGAHGVLLASGVVKAADPHAALLDLARGLP